MKHPCLPIPARERLRLALTARLALAELHAGPGAQALGDLHDAALLLCELLAAERFTDEARQTAQEAAQAIAAARAGAIPPAAVLGPAAALVDLFERALPLVTMRAFEAARVAVANYG